MGVTDDFTKANAHLKQQLGYALDPENSDQFRGLLRLGGYKRFETAVENVKLMGFITKAGERHERLLSMMKVLIPHKVTRYRNSLRQHMAEVEADLDRQLAEAISRDS